jgi:hypothetical protein
VTTNLTRYKDDLEKLTKLGDRMLSDIAYRHLKSEGKLAEGDKKRAAEMEGTFEADYQRWYTEAAAVVRQLIPDRSREFDELYKGDGRRKSLVAETYNVQDWLNGVRAGKNIHDGKLYDDFAIVAMRFKTQLEILKAAAGRFDSALYDIRQLVQADLLIQNWRQLESFPRTGFSERLVQWRAWCWKGIWAGWQQTTMSWVGSSIPQ